MSDVAAAKGIQEAPIADIAYHNKRVVYGLLMQAAAETLPWMRKLAGQRNAAVAGSLAVVLFFLLLRELRYGGAVAVAGADTDRDRFMSAEEAKEYGLVDEVLGPKTAAGKAKR